LNGVIVIGTTRKPSQRIRSFAKELARVLPRAARFTRGKQSLLEFCEEARAQGAERVLLIGGYHGNPGRLVFLHYSQGQWHFQPPLIFIKSVVLLRQMIRQQIPSSKTLYVIQDIDRDKSVAEAIAKALGVSFVNREALSSERANSALLLVALHQRKTLEFLSLQDNQPVGPTLHVRNIYLKPRGDWKRW
jgi:U3 small nucleolar ribonucleoprotein protein IMP4